MIDIFGHDKLRRPRRLSKLRPTYERLDDRCLLSGLSPAEITAAYGLSGLTFTSPTGSVVAASGAGETIALIESYSDPTITSDLHTFDETYGLPDPALTIDNLAGSQTNAGWALEESLDVEWSHAVAPAANILVVEANGQSLQALINAVNTAKDTPGVVAISMSWGFSEFAGENAYNSTFTTPPGHTGITYLASSGDSGSVGGPEWPSTAPGVVAVGGTTLTLSLSGQYLSESPWEGSSGGYSSFEPEPEYQRSVQNTGQRSTPDVSFDGDPNSGVSVYETDLGTGQGSWEVVGGTSLGSPVMAAIIAIADQGRAIAGQGSLDGPSQTLPTLYAVPSSDYHAVSSPGRRRRLSAGATANTITGLGTPNGAALVDALMMSELDVRLSTNSHVGRFAQRAAHARARQKVVHGKIHRNIILETDHHRPAH